MDATNYCASEAVIQSLIDDELRAAERREILSNLARCDSCAKVERAARREADVVAFLFAPDVHVVTVPTGRLWAGIVTALGGAL